MLFLALLAIVSSAKSGRLFRRALADHCCEIDLPNFCADQPEDGDRDAIFCCNMFNDCGKDCCGVRRQLEENPSANDQEGDDCTEEECAGSSAGSENADGQAEEGSSGSESSEPEEEEKKDKKKGKKKGRRKMGEFDVNCDELDLLLEEFCADSKEPERESELYEMREQCCPEE